MAQTTWSTGDKLASFEIHALLGVGAMAEVHAATDQRSGERVALKVLPRAFARDQSRLRRFGREAQTLSETEHPNIVAVHEVGHSAGIPYIAMEYVGGPTLRELLNEGPLELDIAADVAGQIAAGLAEAHRKGVVHRDLKPENIIITGAGTVKILDFGLSKPVGPDRTSDPDTRETSEELTVPGTILGTLEYMSPEQASGDRVDYRTDQFAFGCILHEMLTGTSAFRRATASRTLAAIIEGSAAPLGPHVPDRLRSLVLRCLEKSPEERYVSMEAVKSAIGSIQVDAERGRLHDWFAVGVAMVAALLPKI